MKETLRTLLEAIKYKIDEVVASFPTKLSEFENDLPAIQSDWSQNDDTQLDFIKDKPFYSEYVIGTKTTTLVGTGYISNKELVQLFVNNLETTQVFMDDVECTLKSKTEETDFLTMLLVYECNGQEYNVAVVGATPDSTEYEAISINNGYWKFVITHEGEVEKINKIDGKYLPDGVPYSEFKEIYETRTITSPLQDKEFAQLLVDNRKVVKYEYNGISFVYANDEVISENQIALEFIAENGENLACTINVIASTPYGFDMIIPQPTVVPGTIIIDTVQETVHKLEEKYLPDSIDVNKDWNQNDETSSDYIKNRTHYTEIGTASETRTFVDSLEQDIEFKQLLINNRQNATYLINGIEYTFIEDNTVGDEYAWVCNYVDNEGVTHIVTFLLGTFIDDDGTVVEYIDCMNHDGYSVTVTITINYQEEIVHTLDEKYIPDSIARVTDVSSCIQSEVPNLIFDKIFMKDTVTGYKYIVEMNNGQLISYCAEVTEISVASLPNNIIYSTGDVFDPIGMVVVAKYADGTSKEIVDYVYPETVTGSTITITYGDYSTEIKITNIEELLIDFEYTANEDGTYTLTEWKQTLNGVASTECVVPDFDKIVL